MSAPVTMTDEQAVALEMLLTSVLSDCPEHPHREVLESVLKLLPSTAPVAH